ncbi:MAG: CDP-alcohol phosphatidyltransferase family protein, partial [Minisyncoccales bacterium]
MLDTHRGWFKGLEAKTAKVFAVFPITPNHYTSLSIVSVLVCDYFLIARCYWPALVFFALAAGLDFVDGAVARSKNLSTEKGAYWDTIADRYVDAAILFGLLFAGLPELYFPVYVWIFLSLFGSMMTTYAKAAAKEKGLSDAELKGGLMSRAERLIIFAVVIVSLNYYPALASFLLAALAILTNVTAMQR